MNRNTKGKTPSASAGWSPQKSAKTYNVENWGEGFFSVNEAGHVQVHPHDKDGPSLDLKDLVDELRARGIQLPILIRFSDILRQRIKALNESFVKAIREYDYQGNYVGVYPIKVNQQYHVVEEIVSFGAPYGYGLEAGSKPELLAVLAVLENPRSLIICNGYKDDGFLEMVLLATKMGKRIIPVIEKFSELRAIIALSKKLGVEQPIGVRAKLASKGSGRWEASGGDRSKFGLTVSEILEAFELLKAEGMSHTLQLLHFHLGSQITNIRAIHSGLAEAVRIYVELSKLGAQLKFFDVGGGLGVDYDGSRTNSNSSSNYSLHEYATTVVASIMEACDDEGVAHPIIVSESGRAVTAHQSVLIFNVLGITKFASTDLPEQLPENTDVSPIVSLMQVYRDLTRKNVQEAYHDALQSRDEALSLFMLGYLSLEGRAAAENIYYAICRRILKIVRDLDYVPKDLAGLERAMSDTYICNFSAFQSVPDSWAVQQLFPIMPIHRLTEYPSQRGILADLTCDSDGKIDHFIDLREVKDVLQLHPLNDQPYYLGIFMVGAYQETLGDLHNLFGDTNAVHVRIHEKGDYTIDNLVKGDTVEDVLSYVQFSTRHLTERMRRLVEASVREGKLSLRESAHLLQRYQDGLAGYTYMAE